jgi:FlaA1/EpsC-like NDP-sugar epimerase
MSLVASSVLDTVAMPRSIPLIFFLLALVATGGPRLSARLAARFVQSPWPNYTPDRILVMGAGNAGAMIVREIQRQARPNVTIVGFVDDDPSKHNLCIYGVPVLGDRTSIPELVIQHEVQQVIIAMPSAPGKEVRHICTVCEQAGVKTKVLPGLTELIDSKVQFSQVRDIQIEDLLRREPIQTDMSDLRSLIAGKRVLVTGGGGSIGSELCRQVLVHHPAELIIVGHGENSVFEVHNELGRLVQQIAEHSSATDDATLLTPVIADIRFSQRILNVFKRHKPDIVFHAAAHKHVPLMEYEPVEAIMNNVFGTRALLRAARLTGVEHFVMISTDKAVHPTSIMGATKRVAEFLVHETAIATGRPYVTVRFGNVLGSRGSVVLTFKKQIARGGPITITHPDMRRFFMTIPEAVQLTLQASLLGKGGEVFTLDMGEQIKIVQLARDLIKISGMEIGRDIDIIFTGLRPGEKLYEELFTPDEVFERTTHHKIFIAANASSHVPANLHNWINALEVAVEQDNFSKIMSIFHEIIPQNHFTQARPVVSAEAELQTSQSPEPFGGLLARTVNG